MPKADTTFSGDAKSVKNQGGGTEDGLFSRCRLQACQLNDTSSVGTSLNLNLLKPGPSKQPGSSAWSQRVVATCQKRSADKDVCCRIPTSRDGDNCVFGFAFTNTQITDPRHSERGMPPSSCQSTRYYTRLRTCLPAWNAASACRKHPHGPGPTDRPPCYPAALHFYGGGDGLLGVFFDAGLFFGLLPNRCP